MLKPIEYTLPVYWASYLINGDDSGIDPADKAQADEFLKAHNLPSPVSVGESFFDKSCDCPAVLAGEMADYTFLIAKDTPRVDALRATVDKTCLDTQAQIWRELAEELEEENSKLKSPKPPRKARKANPIKRHFFFTFANRKTSRTYGGENYTLNVFENKGRGRIVHLGTASGCTRGHRGFDSEAWAQVIFPSLTKKTQKAICEFMDKGREQKGMGPSYYAWMLRDSPLAIKLEQY